MPGRSLNLGDYRFGFQNQETDPEIYGTGNAVSYKYCVEETRLGRFLSIDPLAAKYPFYSPYAFSGNRVLDAVEWEGLEPSYSKRIDEVPEEIYSAFKWGGQRLYNIVVTSAEGVYYLLTTDPGESVPAIVEAGAASTSQTAKDVGTLSGYFLRNIYTTATTGKGAQLNEEAFYAAIKRQGDNLVDAAFVGGLGEVAAVVLSRAPSAKLLSAIPCGCFTAQTLVVTLEGYKAISEIQPGDWVWAYNDSTGETALKKVGNTFTYERENLYQLYFSGEQIEVTGDHPFFVGKTWVKVEKLAAGDTLFLKTGQTAILDSLVRVSGSFRVFNFEVEGFHTYFVSPAQILVHNGGPCKSVSDFLLLHSEELIKKSASYEKIKNLSDTDLIRSVTDPSEGNFITINSKTGKVMEGNTRLYELRRRGIEINIPYKTYDPDDSYFPDLEE